MGSIADLPYLKTNPKVIFFSDFDGTITLEDSKSKKTYGISFVPIANQQQLQAMTTWSTT